MRRLVIAIAALVASVSASAGGLDGKTVICGKPSSKPYLGVEFRDGHAVGSIIRIESTVAGIFDYKDSEYSESITFVKFWDEYTLHRDTLKLSIWVGGGEPDTIEYQCEVAGSPSDYKLQLESIRQATQKRIDERMKDNKI